MTNKFISTHFFAGASPDCQWANSLLNLPASTMMLRIDFDIDRRAKMMGTAGTLSLYA
jgi:hypothetical protein